MSCGSHPVMKQFLNQGFCNQRDAAVAFQIYLDLIEVQTLWDVQYAFSSELGLIYLTAKETESQCVPDIFIPISSSKEVSPAWLMKVQDTLSSNLNRSVILALKDTDSTVVYYKLMKGLVPPDSPQSVKEKKELEESQRLMQSEIWRQRNLLLEIANKATSSNNDLQM